VFCSSQDHLKTRTRDLDHPVLARAKNTDSWHVEKGDLQHDFPLDVLTVPLSAIAIAADSKRLMCGGFCLGEIVCLGNFEFIINYFGGLTLSPRRGNTGVTFMGSTHSGASTPRRAMIGDSTDEFLMVPSGEGCFGLLSPRRRGTGALLAPITTTPQMENALVAQATTTVPPWMAAPWPETSFPSA
jgi:hypothetical protein